MALSSPPPELPDIAARSEAVRRALESLRRGAVVAIGDGDDAICVAAVETLGEATLAGLRASAAGPIEVAMTPPRAGALGLGPERSPVHAFLRPAATCADIVAQAQPIAA